MKLATLRIGGVCDEGGGAQGDIWRLLAATDFGALLNAPDFADMMAQPGESVDPDAIEFAPVVPAPGKIIRCGHNYRAHIVEMGRDTPQFPPLFAKFADTLIGAEDDIALPQRGRS